MLTSSENIRELLKLIDSPNREKCFELMGVIDNEPLKSAVGSKHNHQVWAGGYIDHVSEVMRIALSLYESLSRIRELPFSLSDALLILFLHDVEKPYKYGRGLIIAKSENNEFRLKKVAEFGIELSSEQLNALKYVEGENDDYTHGQRVMGPLAAFCHMCDVCSARIWFDQPQQ